jgi:competence protein CoiA
MQLYAFDVNNRLIFSSHAQKQKNYTCPECKGVVRLRGGLQRQNHFFHQEAVRICRQSGKSGRHLAVQYFFLDCLPQEECVLEHSFPEIGRIADVVWLPQKIVFEIQCSFITAAEVQARNKDYASLGFRVVWILHDTRYNKPHLSAMELYLADQPHYFTNMQQNGEGIIYDQFAILRQSRRLHQLPPLPIDIRYLKQETLNKDEYFLETIKNRQIAWNGFFSGDLIDLVENESLEGINYLQKAKILEDKYNLGGKIGYLNIITDILHNYLVRPYYLIFQIFLERCSK